MIKIENVDICGWEEALMRFPAKGYRKTKNDSYEAFVSDHCKTIYLGTYDNKQDAKEAVFNYRASRLLQGIERFGLDIDYSVVFMDKYLAFPNGMIFSLYGEKIVGAIGTDGYIHGIFNGININFHRIIATCFVPNPYNKPFVNHINGIKTDNRVENLEWCTRSENALHSFENGLQNNISGIPVYSKKEKEFIKEHCFDSHKDVANALGRNPETVRKYMYRYRKEMKEHD